MPGDRPRCVVILTALPVEYQAVRAHLSDPHKEIHEKGTIYQQGKFTANHQTWDVIMVETGVGNVFAAVEAERAINRFDPSIILFVGVAGGLKEVKLGDVVVASQVYAYDSGKANITYQVRPKVGIPSYSLEQLARAEAREVDWLQRLRGPMPNPLPHVLVAPIVAGESVVASTSSSLYRFLRKNYSAAVAVEMEGHGFFHAVHANPRVDALIIRGISDLISNKKRADAENWQMIAARHASAFAFEILAKISATELRQNDGIIKTPVATGTQVNIEDNTPPVEVQVEFATSIPGTEGELIASAAPIDNNQSSSEDGTPAIEVRDGSETSASEGKSEDEVSKIPAVDTDQYASTVEPRDTSEAFISSAEDTVLQESLEQVRQYIAKIRDMYDFFSDRRQTFPDQYRHAMSLIDGLEAVIKGMKKYISSSNKVSLTMSTVKVRIDNLLDQISDLRSELRNFPHLYLSSRQTHQYVTNQERIHNKFDSLLESLEELMNECYRL
jgi:nucleoside phosphorylase